jgi:hypothetical protein
MYAVAEKHSRPSNYREIPGAASYRCRLTSSEGGVNPPKKGEGRGRGRAAKGHVRIADNSYVYAPSHTVHLQCTALQDVTFVRLRLRHEKVYAFVGNGTPKTTWASWGSWALVLPCRESRVAMNGEEVLEW